MGQKYEQVYEHFVPRPLNLEVLEEHIDSKEDESFIDDVHVALGLEIACRTRSIQFCPEGDDGHSTSYSTLEILIEGWVLSLYEDGRTIVWLWFAYNI